MAGLESPCERARSARPFSATRFRSARTGRIRIEGLVPESYQVFVNDGGKRLRGGTSFTVNPATGDADDGPQELGEIRVTREAE